MLGYISFHLFFISKCLESLGGMYVTEGNDTGSLSPFATHRDWRHGRGLFRGRYSHCTPCSDQDCAYRTAALSRLRSDARSLAALPTGDEGDSHARSPQYSELD